MAQPFLEITLSSFVSRLKTTLAQYREIPNILTHLKGTICLSRTEAKELVNFLNPSDLYDFYLGLQVTERSKLETFILDKILNQTIVHRVLRQKVIEDFALNLLEEHLPQIIEKKVLSSYNDQLALTLIDRFVQAKQYNCLFPLFKVLEREKSKLELLANIPKEHLTFALSDENDRIRNFAKKLLGFKANQNIDYYSRIRKALHSTLRANFKGTFEKNKTCYFNLINPIKINNHIIYSIIFEWIPPAVESKNRDNYLAFDFYFGTCHFLSKMKWYQRYNQSLFVPLSNLPQTIQDKYQRYYFEKKHYKDLISWIEKELVNFIRTC